MAEQMIRKKDGEGVDNTNNRPAIIRRAGKISEPVTSGLGNIGNQLQTNQEIPEINLNTLFPLLVSCIICIPHFLIRPHHLLPRSVQ